MATQCHAGRLDTIGNPPTDTPGHPETDQGHPWLSVLGPCENIAAIRAMDPAGRPSDFATPSGRAVARLRVPRSADNRVLTGVAAGIGENLGIAADLVRAAFFVLTFAGGIGVLLYLAAWALSVEPHSAPDRSLRREQQVAVGLVFLGGLLLLRGVGLWFGDRVVWTMALLAFGLAAVWARQPGDRRDWLGRLTEDAGRRARVRVLVGAGFVVGGVILLLGSVRVFAQMGPLALAVAATAAGLFLVFGPWIWRLGTDLTQERRERIRTEERAEVAAHLHDSVLQTLSLIQRTDDPARMAMLARAQERELRSWLYGSGEDAGQLGSAIRNLADKVEAEHHIPVELITVGHDPKLDHRTRPLVQASGEAIINAAKHSGGDRITVYVEAVADRVDAWVTDQGHGFDRDAVPHDRRGIRESIVGRMRRSGGGAEIVTRPGEGTEVHLWTAEAPA